MPPPSATQHLPSSHPAARARPKSPARVLKEAEAQWLFNEAELANTPSIQDGMSQEEEKDRRSKGVNFIAQVGILLKLPQLTLSTAAIFFQRFHMRASLKSSRNGIPKLHHFQSAAIALFIAMKVEESCRKMKEMIVACCRVAQKNPNLLVDEQSQDYWKWKDCILTNEDVLLEMLCFDLTVDSPHRQLFNMLKYYKVEHHKKLRNAAWAFVTDAANTQLCLLCTSRTIAVAALYNACKYADVQLPDDSNGRPWWDFHRVQLSEVSKAVEYMAVNIEEAGGQPKGGAPAAGSGAPSSDGGRSIYMGMTPTGAGVANDIDVTRRRDDTKSASPFSGSQSQNLIPQSDRRASNASSVGVKRDREEAGLPPTNGVATNGTGGNGQESKRAKLEINGDSQPAPAPTTVKGNTPVDIVQAEEAARVEHANKESEKQVQATASEARQEAAEGSEEGEVEE